MNAENAATDIRERYGMTLAIADTPRGFSWFLRGPYIGWAVAGAKEYATRNAAATAARNWCKAWAKERKR